MAQAQDHLDPLSALDAAFLFQERPNAHMHIGGVAIFDGPPPDWDDFLEHVRTRLDRVPRYRQKLAEPPLGPRAPALDRRPELQPRVPRPPQGAAEPGRRGRAAPPDRAHLLAAPRPRQAALGAAAHRGPRGRPLRAADEDPPQRRRRHQRRRHHGRALRHHRAHARRPTPARASGSPGPSRAPPSSPRCRVNGTLRDVGELPLRAAGDPRRPAAAEARGAGRERGGDDACCAPRPRPR